MIALSWRKPLGQDNQLKYNRLIVVSIIVLDVTFACPPSRASIS